MYCGIRNISKQMLDIFLTSGFFLGKILILEVYILEYFQLECYSLNRNRPNIMEFEVASNSSANLVFVCFVIRKYIWNLVCLHVLCLSREAKVFNWTGFKLYRYAVAYPNTFLVLPILAQL